MCKISRNLLTVIVMISIVTALLGCFLAPHKVAAQTIDIVSHTSYRDGLNYHRIVGEVVNNTGSNAKFVKITATYYDSGDVFIGFDFTYTELDILLMGQKSPFDLSSYPEELPALDYYVLQVQYLATADEPFTGS